MLLFCLNVSHLLQYLRQELVGAFLRAYMAVSIWAERAKVKRAPCAREPLVCLALRAPAHIASEYFFDQAILQMRTFFTPFSTTLRTANFHGFLYLFA